MKDEFLDKLPESLKIIVRLTDLSTALVLVNQFGGRNLHVPTTKMINENHELAYLIGFNNLKQICKYFNGDTIYIPKAQDYAQYLRDEKIRQDSQKLNPDQLSKKYNVSTRWIREIIRRGLQPQEVKKDDRQLDMFEP
ncbi:Mor transcription activator family protein [Acinetobacter junii]|uniref:Mor transcription activator family protein n=1 Tax=Acinetobacter junii TaxID=40215 RepID=UPI00100E23BD|nr:Mor transcription activator family protein [Acinetobacter junii]RXS92953.1 hypothetical protein ETZ13_14220 [Acinetobacter junii]